MSPPFAQAFVAEYVGGPAGKWAATPTRSVGPLQKEFGGRRAFEEGAEGVEVQ